MAIQISSGGVSKTYRYYPYDAFYIDANGNVNTTGQGQQVREAYFNGTKYYPDGVKPPAKIVVVNQPSRADYSDIVVVAYTADDEVWYDTNYPDGVIPFNELNITSRNINRHSVDGFDADVTTYTYAKYTEHRNNDSYNRYYEFEPLNDAVMVLRYNCQSLTEIYFASKNAVSQIGKRTQHYMSYGRWQTITTYYDEIYSSTYFGKTVYHAGSHIYWATSPTEIKEEPIPYITRAAFWPNHTESSTHKNLPAEYSSRAEWLAVYGNTFTYIRRATVTWTHDGQTMTTTYDSAIFTS